MSLFLVYRLYFSLFPEARSQTMKTKKFQDVFNPKVSYKEGEPCAHPGCLSHLTHPCEGCGRVGGKTQLPYTVIGNFTVAQKEAIVKKRLREGWTCHVNTRTGIRHIWIPPSYFLGGEKGAERAIRLAQRFGGIDGDHHKAWVIDQMIRALTGKGYGKFLKDTCDGADGPNTYSWDTGIAP